VLAWVSSLIVSRVSYRRWYSLIGRTGSRYSCSRTPKMFLSVSICLKGSVSLQKLNVDKFSKQAIQCRRLLYNLVEKDGILYWTKDGIFFPFLYKETGTVIATRFHQWHGTVQYHNLVISSELTLIIPTTGPITKARAALHRIAWHNNGIYTVTKFADILKQQIYR
jgi:hypothetical protein